MKLMSVISATGLAAGLALGGVVVANATSSPSPTGNTSNTSNTGITLPKGGVLEHRVTSFCERTPKLEQRVARSATRLAGDADTKGSIARLKARQAKAAKNDHPKAAERLGKVVERRTERLAKLPTVKKNLVTAKAECATLPAPAPS